MEGVIWGAVGTIVTIIITTICTKLGLQIKKYKKLLKEEEDKTVKDTMKKVLGEELEPIRGDMQSLRKDVLNMQDDINGLQDIEVNFSTRFKPVQEEIEAIKDDITEILLSLKEQGIDLDKLKNREEFLEKQTCSAWRYRIRYLCHAYLERNYMTNDELEQLQEMFTVYEALGGNGQTKDLYQKTLKLPVHS